MGLFEGTVPGGHNYSFHRRKDVSKNPDVILCNHGELPELPDRFSQAEAEVCVCMCVCVCR